MGRKRTFGLVAPAREILEFMVMKLRRRWSDLKNGEWAHIQACQVAIPNRTRLRDAVQA